MQYREEPTRSHCGQVCLRTNYLSSSGDRSDRDEYGLSRSMRGIENESEPERGQDAAYAAIEIGPVSPRKRKPEAVSAAPGTLLFSDAFSPSARCT